MTSDMKYFSTFSGIGGFELGIQLAYENNRPYLRNRIEVIRGDMPNSSESPDRPTCIGYSEIDKYASQIYQKHFQEYRCEIHNRPTREKEEDLQTNLNSTDTKGEHTRKSSASCGCRHINYGDITKIVAEDLPDFDLLVGGFPCQTFSIAGKRAGFEDTRGTMFFELARILRAKQPRLCVFENVKGLLSHDGGKSFSTIIQTLDELGYDLQWQVLNSKNHGVPQNRERVFIIGHLRGTPRPEVFPFGGNDGTATDIQGHNANTLTARYYGAEATGTYIEEGKLDAQIQQLNSPKHSNDRVYGADGISPTLNTMQGGNRQPFVAIRNDGMEVEMDIANSVTPDAYLTSGKRGLDENGKSQLTSMCDRRIRRLTPTECERLQGFPDNWTEGVSDTQRYKTLGNAVTVNVIRDIMEKLL